jgi:Skp family chaperone for outer membrane proteins
MKLISLLILILVLTAASYAQSTTANKVAVIDTEAFSKREQGIKKLIRAENSYSIESFGEENYLTEKIDTLKKEIYCLQNQNKSIADKNDELQKLKAELKNIREGKKAEYERKYSLVVSPVVEKIREKLKDFAKLKGYVIVIDKSEDSILVEGEVDDITSDFIRFCNESFEKENLQ